MINMIMFINYLRWEIYSNQFIKHINYITLIFFLKFKKKILLT